jgi:uncharacterized protein HemY
VSEQASSPEQNPTPTALQRNPIAAGFSRMGIALAVALVLASHHSGYMQLVYPPYRIEMSLVMFLLLQLALIVIAYLALEDREIARQIEWAERWLALHPDDAGPLLALGKLCLQQGLWGKAQNYLDTSISLNSSHVAYTTLGQLAEKPQKPDGAFRHFQRAMELAKAGE